MASVQFGIVSVQYLSSLGSYLSGLGWHLSNMWWYLSGLGWHLSSFGWHLSGLGHHSVQFGMIYVQFAMVSVQFGTTSPRFRPVLQMYRQLAPTTGLGPIINIVQKVPRRSALNEADHVKINGSTSHTAWPRRPAAVFVKTTEAYVRLNLPDYHVLVGCAPRTV